jgi:predicted small lipoprotein YifL
VTRRRALALLVALACTAIAACGVQNDHGPRELAPSDVPFDLLAPATSVAESPPESGVDTTIWFVDNAGLLSRARRSLDPPVTVDAALESLLEGVTEAEANNGLRSNITSDTELLDVAGPDDGLVTVDLSSDFLNVERELQRLALAQIVFTATSLPNVDRVLFRFDGEPAEVPGAGDELTSEPLTRDDFVTFNPNVPTTTPNP